MEKECPQCTRKFKPGRVDQVYCNNLCRQRAYLERRNSGPYPVLPAYPLQHSFRHGVRPKTVDSSIQPVSHYSPTKSPADIDDESYGRDFAEEKIELRELIKNWDIKAIYAIKNKSIAALTELQDQMKRELTCKMYYEPEHNELLSPMYGVVYALESAIERFHASTQDQYMKWYFLEKAFTQAKRGCEYLF